MELPKGKYKSFPTINLKNRTWPNNAITKAPVWCSVDLRDGNQALINPMSVEQKIKLFKMICRVGFLEIETGFPSASKTEFSFVRSLVENRIIPDKVRTQVLTQARDHLIKKTFESLKGYKQAIVHLYNSTSEVQRRIVFRQNRDGITDIARKGADTIRKLTEQQNETNIMWQYSPESFSTTELDYAVEICSAVIDIWEPTPKKPIIINCPATVETSSPNIFADQIEYMHKHLPRRDSIILSVHPHNDRGTAVASAELSLLAGAQRIEGTLFGNGERTGNVDIATCALNLFSQGIEPKLDFSNIKEISSVIEYCTNIPVHQRHPYVGELVFTAFSGSHQDAIKKGIHSRKLSNNPIWEVPYLPIDPADIGRNYEPIVRVNSQSGKAGIAFVLEHEIGLELPRTLQVEFSHIVQERVDSTGLEINPDEIYKLFKQVFVLEAPLKLEFHKLYNKSNSNSLVTINASLQFLNQSIEIIGKGNGPIDALTNALNKHFSCSVTINNYHQHAIGSGATAKSVTYIEISTSNDVSFGVGFNENTMLASLKAVTSGFNRMINLGQLSIK